MSKVLEVILSLSVIVATAVGALLWVQSGFVSAMDFAEHQNTSDQSLILLQLTDKRYQLNRLRVLQHPSVYEEEHIDELKYDIDLLQDNLKKLQKVR